MNYHTLDSDSPKIKNNNDDKEPTSTRGRLCCGTTVLDGVAATAVASSMVTWISSSNIIVKLASGCTFVFGPLASWNQRKLKHFGSLRNHHNHLRAEVNYLHQEQERLQRSLVRLDTNVLQMERVEQELNYIAGSPQQVHRLLQVIQEQDEVNDLIKENLKKSVLQNILTVVVKSDVDQNFCIHAKELEMLIVRLNMMKGVNFHEEKFRELVGTNSQSLSAIMKLIRSLLQDDDESVFALRPEDLLKE